jgi:hypothetical protein
VIVSECRAAEWRIGALQHYCDSSLVLLGKFELSPAAARAFVVLDRQAARKNVSGQSNTLLLATQRGGNAVMQASLPRPPSAGGGLPLLLASERSAGPFQATLRLVSQSP